MTRESVFGGIRSRTVSGGKLRHFCCARSAARLAGLAGGEYRSWLTMKVR